MVALLWTVCHAQLANTQPTPSAPKGRAAELMLRGTFGEDFDELTVERFLTAAKGAEIDTVIFRLESGGGYVVTASAMLAVLDKHRNQFTYVCRIKSAISASLWIVCGCDEVLIEPNGEVGGAVIYATTSTGSTEVDAKQNSIKATRLATNGASISGIPELLVRAMIEMPVQVWWHRASRTLRDNAPADRDGWEEIDSPTRVLTLSASQATELGFAKSWSESPGQFRGMRIATGPGNSALAQTAKQSRSIAKLKAGLDLLTGALVTANSKRHPDDFADYTYSTLTWIDKYTGTPITTNMTSASREVWHHRFDDYLAAWQAVAKRASEIERECEVLERSGIPALHRELVTDAIRMTKDAESRLPVR